MYYKNDNDILIHSTAVVETMDIDKGTFIGPFSYIGPRVKIGKNCKIIGHCSIGTAGEHPNSDEDNGGIVEIGDNVEIREFVTINTPIFDTKTYLANGCYLMAKSHVGHDAILHERVVLHTEAIIGGCSEIGKYCYMGLNCVTHPHAKLGDYCIVGASSFYKGESPSALVWAGVPARALKINKVGIERHVSSEGEAIRLMQEAHNFLRETNDG